MLLLGSLSPLLAWGLVSNAAAAGSTAATLTVLAPRVERIAPATGAREVAATGTSLREGERIVTGPDGLALITFLDGSTVTVQPGSDVTVAPPRAADRDGLRFTVLIHAGKVWARVARLLGSQAAVALESNEYAATARDGLIGAERAPDGRFVCWSRAGDLVLTDAGGRVLAHVPPERKATVAPGRRRAAVEGFRVNASALRVSASATVAPLLEMPGGRGVAGFASGDTVVNQVFGSLSAEGASGRLVEVPAGTRGPYTLRLHALADGPFAVEVTGAHLGELTYRRALRGIARAGQVLEARIEQRLTGLGPQDPRTARAWDAKVTLLGSWGEESAHLVGGR
jgi:hypothetical protein